MALFIIILGMGVGLSLSLTIQTQPRLYNNTSHPHEQHPSSSRTAADTVAMTSSASRKKLKFNLRHDLRRDRTLRLRSRAWSLRRGAGARTNRPLSGRVEWMRVMRREGIAMAKARGRGTGGVKDKRGGRGEGMVGSKEGIAERGDEDRGKDVKAEIDVEIEEEKEERQDQEDTVDQGDSWEGDGEGACRPKEKILGADVEGGGEDGESEDEDWETGWGPGWRWEWTDYRWWGRSGRGRSS
jgi:hypothetical protein